jgi:aryl-phospho-beta-D-glucosidase BglC (GH1 family)
MPAKYFHFLPQAFRSFHCAVALREKTSSGLEKPHSLFPPHSPASALRHFQSLSPQRQISYSARFLKPLQKKLRPLSVLALFFAASLPLSGAADERFLTANGNEIHDAKGRTVLLRGVNLGGWLVIEPWMSPVDSSGTIKCDYSVREILAKRFGGDAANSLLETYQKNWITEKDFDKIAAHGMNVIRIPFWYRNVQTEDGVWIPTGLKELDWAVTEAWKRGIYSIIDFHGVPGGQSKGDSTGRKREEAEFWNDETHQQRTIEIWRKVAEHFKGNPAVAAYDLINEPADAPSLGALWSVYDRLYREIRKIDPDHIITVEGCATGQIGGKYVHWGWEALPPPDLFGWKNVLYQMHHYEWDWKSEEKQITSIHFQVSEWNKHKKLGVPAFMGEFNPMGTESAWNHALKEYSASGMHWTFWSYKANHGTGSNSWGLYNPIKKDAPNLLTDSAETIRAKWEALDTDTYYALNPMLDRVLKGVLKQPLSVASETSPIIPNP